MRRRSGTGRYGPLGAAIGALALIVGLGIMGGCAQSPPGTTGTSAGASSSAARGSVVAPGAPSESLPSAVKSGTSAGGSGSSSGSSAALARLIVVNKTLLLQATSVDKTMAKVRALAARYGGDIADLQVSTRTDQPVAAPTPATVSESGPAPAATSDTALQAYVVVRVPVANYNDFTAQASNLGRVVSQSESAQDVTQQHVDLKARLGNLRSEQAALRVMFRRAGSIRDMLSVEQELARVQGDIESLQGQIDYLENQAALATITIEIAEPQPIVRPAGTDWGVGAAVTKSVRAFVDTLNILIEVLGPLLALVLFLVLPIALLVWLGRVLLRKWRLRRRIQPAASPAPERRDS